jgi:phosphosulfolactate synthase (CoM biosynthesis protein A)
MLEYHIGRFNEEYASDLELLGFESLEVVDGKVAISEVSTLSCLMETLLHKFDEVGFKVDIEDNFLYVEED